MEKEHILVCLSSSPTNTNIIRSAAHMAQAFGADFSALYVEVSGLSLQAEDKQRLEQNTALAKELGARIERVYGDDIPYQIAEFARLRGVTKIVIGRSSAGGRGRLRRRSLTDRLLYYAPNLEIHIIPDSSLHRDYRIKPAAKHPPLNRKDSFKSILMLAAASVIGLILETLGLTQTGILPVFILSVLLIAMTTTGYFYWLLSSIGAVIVFNYFFTDPRYTLLAYDADYPVTFLIMFVVSVLAGNLTMRLKRAAQQSSQAAHRTKLIFDTDQMLSMIRDPEKITETTARQIAKLTAHDVVYYLNQSGTLTAPKMIEGLRHDSTVDFTAPAEREAALWTLKHNHNSGASATAVPYASARYYAIRMNDTVYGVIGIANYDALPDAYENSILISLLGECALALENTRNESEKEEAKLRARNEQTRADLLRSISHDLRTPLTTISGNADNLLHNEFDAETRKRIYSDIYSDSMWLNDLVENLLAISKVGSEDIARKMTVEVMDDVISEAIKHIDRKSCDHTIEINACDTPLLVRMDPHLIMQVIVNLVNNAIKYTPAGSMITVCTRKEGTNAVLEVIDDGPGIDESERERIFELFQTGNKKSADSRRGLGLGLALCKSIVTVHGGSIYAVNKQPHGLILHFTLPLEVSDAHE